MNIYEENGQVSIGSKPPRDGRTSFEVTPPETKEFRAAWTLVDGVIVLDSTKAEAIRVKSITDKADAHVLANYSELKQRKLLSIAVALIDKRDSTVLSTAEDALLQDVRDVNTQITAWRVIENNAIANGDAIGDVTF